jgi:hypothetical protein
MARDPYEVHTVYDDRGLVLDFIWRRRGAPAVGRRPCGVLRLLRPREVPWKILPRSRHRCGGSRARATAPRGRNAEVKSVSAGLINAPTAAGLSPVCPKERMSI